MLIKLSLEIYEESSEINFELLRLSVQCLLSIGGSFTHKSFIPGENRELEKLRSMLIERGGLVVFLLIK